MVHYLRHYFQDNISFYEAQFFFRKVYFIPFQMNISYTALLLGEKICLLQLRLLLMITSNLNLESSVNPLQLSKLAKTFTQVETQKK